MSRRVGYLLVAVIGAVAAGATGVWLGGPEAAAGEVRTQQETAAAERTIALAAGFNLVGWTGSESIGAADAAAAIPGATAIFDFDAATQEFRSYRPGARAILNTLAEVAPRSAVWVQVEHATAWAQPATTESTTIPLQPGFNLVVWTGPSGTPVEEAVAPLGDALTAVLGHDAAPGGFVSYGQGQHAFLNTLIGLNYGDGLYVQVSRAVTWVQPAAMEGGQTPGSDEEPEPAPAPEPMQVTSPAFGNNERIPIPYTCDGADVSPPLTITNIPAEAVTLAVIMDDSDAAIRILVHWAEFNIAPQEELAAGVAGGIGTGVINSSGAMGYVGPCPPLGETHRYIFRVYALDTMFTLAPGATIVELLTAMEGHILQEATLVGLYSS